MKHGKGSAPRRRMDEAMVLRGFSPRALEAYLACVTGHGRGQRRLRMRRSPSLLRIPLALRHRWRASERVAASSRSMQFD